MDCQIQSNGNALSCVLYIPKSHDMNVLTLRVLYIHWRGVFSVARFDNPGNAKALTRGTGDRQAPRFFYAYGNAINNMLYRSRGVL